MPHRTLPSRSDGPLPLPPEGRRGAAVAELILRDAMSAGAPWIAPPITGEDEIAWAGLRRQALILDRTIGVVAEVLGAGIVVAETCILFAGVVSRYVFNSPLMWTDELANFLFLWLAMLGTVVALRRDETCV